MAATSNVDNVALHWFRKDLRLHDNCALLDAIQSCSSLIPLFILDDEILDTSKTSTNRLGFLLDSLSSLDASLREKGSRLMLVQGNPTEVLPKLIEHFNVKRVTVTHISDPQMVKDEKVMKICKESGAIVERFFGHTLFNPECLLSLNGGKAPDSFQEFLKIIGKAGEPEPPLEPPVSIPPPPVIGNFNAVKIFKKIPTLKLLKEPEERTSAVPAGESAALMKMQEFLSVCPKVLKFDCMKTNPSSLIQTDTSVLSYYLANGNLSVRLFYHNVKEVMHFAQLQRTNRGHSRHLVPESQSLIGQLYRRELSYLVGFSTPGFDLMTGNPYCECMMAPWLEGKKAKKLAELWAQGMTGYPLVDACMRQLKKDGWIHYVSRHMCVSFLTKGDFHISWMVGRDIFHKYLLDADWSINTFSWHKMTCNKFFPEPHQPPFNALSYFKQFDPHGTFIRDHVPELKNFPSKYIYEPWKASKKVQGKSGCIVGVDYPNRFAGSKGMHMYQGDQSPIPELSMEPA